MSPRLMRWRKLFPLSGLPTFLALASFALIVLRAVATADPYWDTLAYHWPYAARLAGLCDRECFALSFGIERRYEGFPLLLTAMQGLLWRVTGTPAFADLINIAALVALGVYLKLRFAVPLAWSWLAFLAIPTVQIQLTSSYIDVPVNAAVTLALMVVLRILVQADGDHRADILIALAALGVAVGSKYQMLPIALITWGVIILLAIRNPAIVRAQRREIVFGTLCLAGVIVLLPKLVMNVVNFGNPLYPIEFDFGPVHFQGSENMMPRNSISDAWIAWPRPVRWVASVLEFDAFRGRPLPWTLDQADVPQSNASFRMGGYFVPYVLGAVALVWWSARSVPAAKWPAALVIALSLICASMPMSHELRYYMFWMLTLVSCVLVIVYSPIFANPQQALQRKFTNGVVAIALASVIMMTGAAYLRVRATTLHDLLVQTDATVAQIPDGGALCILNMHPYGFLYASVFHPPRRYHTKSLRAGEQADCTIRLDLDKQR
ncbi:MAG TPA: hypothetical protein VGR42_08880 [Casimicrobiaceae bacterium]|nr:hypothetical protein [Casimicrobiaceae bacterium]